MSESNGNGNGEKLGAAAFLRWYNTLLTTAMGFVIVMGVGKLDKGLEQLNQVRSDTRILEVRLDNHKVEGDARYRELRDADRELRTDVNKCLRK